MATAFYRANLRMRLAGHIVVRDIELAERDRVIGLRVEPGSDGEFLWLRFEEAIANFLSRQHVSPDEFAAMSDQERFRSWTMSLVASETLRDRALEDLRDAMEPGGVGLREFIRAYEDTDGGIPKSYLENVYRTSTATSYGAGRYEVQTAPDIASALPYWEYLTVGDDRVRPAHAALHEAVFRVGSEAGKLVYPPNGYQCRCTVVSLDEDEVDLSRLQEDLTQEQLAAVTEGFRGSPLGHIEEESGTRSPVVQVPEPARAPVKDAVQDIPDGMEQRMAREALELWVGNSTKVSASAGRWDDPSVDWDTDPVARRAVGATVGKWPEEVTPQEVEQYRRAMQQVEENTRRHWLENNLGVVRVYRGISGDQAREVRRAFAAGAEYVDVEVRALSSWTTDRTVASSGQFAGRDGVVLVADVTQEDVFATHHSTRTLRTESEVVRKHSGGFVRVYRLDVEPL